MTLIRNTLVFLETNFFISLKPMSNEHWGFLEYSKDEKIALCTSYICLREWRQQLIGGMHSYRDKNTHLYSDKRRQNILADVLLDGHPPYNPSDEDIEKASIQIIDKFVKDNRIRIYPPTEEHIERTFEAYFNGDAPYKGKVARDDIPDSWIFEAAKDARFDEGNKGFQNKFSIGNDKKLNIHLNDLGLQPITKFDLLELLQREEDEFASGVQETTKKLSKVIATPSDLPVGNGLDGVLSSAMNGEVRDIYVRLLGYTYWLSGPSKKDLFSIIESNGFDRQLVEASATILSQPSLGLVDDIGNHFLPKNTVACEAAADLIMEEILEGLS